MSEIFQVLFTAGGAAFLSAVFLGLKTLRDGRSAQEDSVTKRLNDDAKQAHDDADAQRDRAIAAQADADQLRVQRDASWNAEARMRRLLIKHGIDPELEPGGR